MVKFDRIKEKISGFSKNAFSKLFQQNKTFRPICVGLKLWSAFLASLNLPLVVGWGRGATDKATAVVVNDPGSTPAAEKKFHLLLKALQSRSQLPLWHYGIVVMIIVLQQYGHDCGQVTPQLAVPRGCNLQCLVGPTVALQFAAN